MIVFSTSNWRGGIGGLGDILTGLLSVKIMANRIDVPLKIHVPSFQHWEWAYDIPEDHLYLNVDGMPSIRLVDRCTEEDPTDVISGILRSFPAVAVYTNQHAHLQMRHPVCLEEIRNAANWVSTIMIASKHCQRIIPPQTLGIAARFGDKAFGRDHIDARLPMLIGSLVKIIAEFSDMTTVFLTSDCGRFVASATAALESNGISVISGSTTPMHTYGTTIDEKEILSQTFSDHWSLRQCEHIISVFGNSNFPITAAWMGNHKICTEWNGRSFKEKHTALAEDWIVKAVCTPCPVKPWIRMP
jgi:hypothetical protein